MIPDPGDQINQAIDSLFDTGMEAPLSPPAAPAQSNPLAWERHEPFRPTFSAAYLAWAEVGMIAPLLGNAHARVEEFVNSMREGLGIIIAKLEESKKAGQEFYGINLDGLLQDLYGTDLKLQGYPGLLTAYAESKVDLQNALQAALPEGTLNLDVGKEQLRPLKPIYFKHFMWVGRQMVFELAILDITKARSFSGTLVDAKNCYRNLIEEAQAEALNEGMQALESIHEALCALDQRSDQIQRDRHDLQTIQFEIQEAQDESKRSTLQVQDVVKVLQGHADDLQKQIARVGSLVDQFVQILGRASAAPSGETEPGLFDALFEQGDAISSPEETLVYFATKGDLLKSDLKGIKEIRSRVLDHSKQIKEAEAMLREVEARIAETKCQIRDGLAALEDLCKFPGQARVLHEEQDSGERP